MKELVNFLNLPASLLALIVHSRAYAHELEWPYNLPATAKYYPEHEALMRQDFKIRQRMEREMPAGVKKMRSDDEGEKFFLQYWQFGEEQSVPTREDLPQINNTFPQPLLGAPIALHTIYNCPQLNLFGRNIFARGFQCPTDTKPCSNLGSNLCCPKDQNCVSVSGGVGCCPLGETCSNVVSECDVNAGYSSCPSSPDGGCCIPNATCEGSGCVFYGTQTVTATLATDTVTESQSNTPSAVSSDTASPPSPAVSTEVSISGYTTTQTVTVTESISGQATTIVSILTQSPELTTSHTIMPSLTCTSGYQSCPASLGGGCCPTGQMCGLNNLCLSFSESTTTTTDPGAPILPTSVSPDTSQTAAHSTQQTTTTTLSSSNAACPTGYYMCSAYYLGGCCRVGRDCDTTSCPSTASTTVISSDATILVPATTEATSTQGNCPHGWYMCPASVGGDCCPSQYVCGTSSCSATASGEQNTGKELPSSANVIGWAWIYCAMALATGIGMLWL